jgi:hypothetical protein
MRTKPAHLALVDAHDTEQQLAAEAQREGRLWVQQRLDAVVDARRRDLLPLQAPVKVRCDPHQAQRALLGQDLGGVEHGGGLLGG